MKCRIHNLRFKYTCPACEDSWAYVIDPPLKDYFDAGVRGEKRGTTIQQKAANERGFEYYNQEKKSKNSVDKRHKNSYIGSESNKKRKESKMANKFQSKLKKAKKSTPKKVKPTKDQKIFEVNPEGSPKERDVAEEITEVVKWKKELKKAKAELKASEAVVISYGREIQDDLGFDDNFKKSFEISNGKDSVKYVSADKWSVSDEDEDKIKKLVGQNNFDDLFETEYTIKVKDDVFDSEEKQEELMELLGDKFDEFLEITSKLKTKKSFDEKLYKKVKTQKKLDEVRSIIKQSKPSLR